MYFITSVVNRNYSSQLILPFINNVYIKCVEVDMFTVCDVLLVANFMKFIITLESDFFINL